MIAVLAVTFMMGGMLAFGASSASAGPLPIPQNTSASVSTADGWHGKCAFSVKSVDSNTYAVTGHIGAIANVKSDSAYANDVYTEVDCYLYDSAFNSIDFARFFANGPNLPQQRVLVTEAYSPQYHICTVGYVKLHDGTDSGPFSSCS